MCYSDCLISIVIALCSLDPDVEYKDLISSIGTWLSVDLGRRGEKYNYKDSFATVAF
jgi:hypothetical protein